MTNLGTGYYFIRRETGDYYPVDYEFFDGYGMRSEVTPDNYTRLEDVVSAWLKMDSGFRAFYHDAYIVGPKGGYYTLEGERKVLEKWKTRKSGQ